VPEIILANLWNFVRRYSPELRFLTSCGESRSALCRRRNYTSHIEMVRLSPIHTSMAQIQQELKQSAAVPEHQNFFNLQHLGFTESGAIFPFHLELRFPDADLSATSITAKTFLFFAMLLKAVELSQYGVIHVGKITPWRRKIELLDMLSNNDGALATSDTSCIDDAAIDELRQGCHELLDLLEPVFDRFEDNPSLEVLQLLAETPISLLRSGGHDWQSIEALLSQRAQLEDYSVDEIELKLMQHIEFEDWGEAKSIEEWKWNAASRLFLTPHDLDAHLQRIEGKRGLRWNERLGTYVFNR
jgi:hypothetical protein